MRRTSGIGEGLWFDLSTCEQRAIQVLMHPLDVTVEELPGGVGGLAFRAGEALATV